MINVHDVNLAVVVVDSISDAVLSASRSPKAFKWSLERCSNATRLF
jgi:hypothetical protein